MDMQSEDLEIDRFDSDVSVEALSDDADVEGSDELDTRAAQREMDLSMLETVETELNDVENALQKLSDGSYGKCETCDEPIDEERLSDLPAARTCAEHAVEAPEVTTTVVEAAPDPDEAEEKEATVGVEGGSW